MSVHWHLNHHLLISLLAAMEVPPDQRDFLGRWRASSSSDEYIRTARVIVMRLQAKAVQGLLLSHLRKTCSFFDS